VTKVSTISGLVLLFAAAAVRAGPVAELPPYTAAYEPSSVDERGMWMVADEDERRIRSSALLMNDDALTGYVKRVLCDTVGQDRCKSVRVYILEVPLFNASMRPNGAMTVWTGLLLRVRSEAELGAVLGHEFAHFELRHSLQGFKQRRGASDVSAWIMMLGAMTNTNMSSSQQSILGSVYRFNRDQERAADLLGLQYLRQSKYPADSAAAVWTNMMAEADATAAGRAYKKKHSYSAGFFDTHPTELARSAYLKKESEAVPDPGDPGVAQHRAAIAASMPRLLSAQNKRNDFGGTDYLLNELAKISGWTGELLFARAELYRERGNPRDLVTASELYKEALKAGYNTPDIYRGLGLSLLRNGEVADGKGALGEYLKLKPDAGDAKLIQTLIAE
jgi:Zn-dependent protease with chaperone function